MKDARYFKHDANARHDPKIKALINKYGIEGYGRFWIIIEMMREATHYKLEDKLYVMDALAEEMKCTSEQAKNLMEDCVLIFELFTKDNGFYYSESFLSRMVSLELVRSKRKLAADIRHGNLDD